MTNNNWARFSGLAEIEGRPGSYRFRVDARDGERTGMPDQFAIRLWAPGSDPDRTAAAFAASGPLTTGQVRIRR